MRRGEVLAVLRRRMWWGLVPFLLLFSALVTAVVSLPNVYRAEAMVLIERQQIPDDIVRSAVSSALEVRLQTMSQEILSRTRLEDLIKKFRLYEDMKKASADEIVDQMRRDTSIELEGERGRRSGPRGTVAFGIKYTGRDRQKVAEVANAIASSYVDENVRMRERQATGAATFVRDELEKTSRRLEELEAALSRFKEKHAGELPEQMDSNSKTLDQLNAQLRTNTETQIHETETRASLARRIEEVTRSMGIGGGETAGTRLAQLRESLAAAQARLSDNHPDVIRLKAEIAALEREPANARTPAAPGPVAQLPPWVLDRRRELDETDARLTTLAAEAANLRQSIALYQTRVKNSPKREQEYEALSRDYEATKAVYQSLLKRGNESQLAENMEMLQKSELFRIIEPALPPDMPAAPRRLPLFLVALLVSVSAGAASLGAREFLDDAVPDLEALRECCAVPVLASIPEIVTVVETRQRRRLAMLATACTLAGILLLAGGSHILTRHNWGLTALLVR